MEEIRSNEELASDIQVEIQALGIDIVKSLRYIQMLLESLLGALLLLGIIATIHFW